MTENHHPTFAQIEQKIDYIIEKSGGYWSPSWLLAAITEELGEVSKELQLLEGLRPNKEGSKARLKEEIGDVLFTLICLARRTDVDIISAVSDTIVKYGKRIE
jgi:NTP pyrophosphatase (non-canonical NTP hydrolase)